MKIACVQMRPTFKDKLGNLRKMAHFTKQAAEKGARLIIFPELISTGYSFRSDAEAREHAEFIHPDILTTKSMRVLAETLNVHIVWGMVEKDGGTGDLYNSQVMVSPDGTWVSTRKVNRFGSDYLWAKAGRSNPPIVEIDDEGKTLKVGLLICRDVRDRKDKHWDSFYEKGDADLVCLSSNWGKGAIPANAWMDFVEDNDCVLAVANRWGEEENNDFGHGGSCIIEPPDVVHFTGLVWSADCIIYAEV